MASSRDDFIIAIRSAFLKKSTQQKFSLLTLVFLSIFIIVLSGINFSAIKKIKTVIHEIVYRSSFIVSLPENFIKDSYISIKEYSNFYNDYEKNKVQLKQLRSENISSEIVKSENKELKELIEDYTLTKNKILAKVIVDHQSPFLKTVIINKGSADRIKIGTNIYDRSYLVGRVIEVNFKSSRVLLLSDLNSNVSISIVPGNIQAIITGNGENSGEIKYTKDNLTGNIEDQSIAYTSGAGSIFKSGIPVGKLNTPNSNTEKIKLNLLNEEIEILNESNSKLTNKNKFLNSETNQLKQEIRDLQTKIKVQLDKINQNNIDQQELEFLKLNLIYSSKCQKTVFKKGFKIGTQEYRDCIFRKGKKNR